MKRNVFIWISLAIVCMTGVISSEAVALSRYYEGLYTRIIYKGVANNIFRSFAESGAAWAQARTDRRGRKRAAKWEVQRPQ